MGVEGGPEPNPSFEVRICRVDEFGRSCQLFMLFCMLSLKRVTWWHIKRLRFL